MPKAPLISVVMSTYNGEKYISEAIQSILDQTFLDFEFIIVNDGSTDSTEAIIKSFKDHRMRYIKKAMNSGIADSLNLGIAEARGTYIARMDDDDVSLPKRFEKQLEVFKQDPEVMLCATSVYAEHDKVYPIPIDHDGYLMRLLFYNPIFHPTVMIVREALLKNMYDPSFVPAEDHELWSRLIFVGKFQGISEPLMKIGRHATGSTAQGRKKQLYFNAIISQRIYDKLGYKKLKGHDLYLTALTSSDYTLKGKTLRGLITWAEQLKSENKRANTFYENQFNEVLEGKLRHFLKCYFMNKTILNKLIPYLYMQWDYKLIILNIYIKR